MTLFTFPVQAATVPWPETGGVEAEGAILMDADTGIVLYGKNMHERYYPASITKILTALLVIENCDLDEEVEFSHRAVFDVESGSSSAGYDVGDRITVRVALYAMLLKSANEVANALAEHVDGSIEAFCERMNRRAEELGCKNTHFANPSGLNNDEHYTSAYDFALICREAFANETFVQFNGTTYFTLPPSLRNKEETTIYAHHSMLKKSNALYYDGIIGGKTGYTSKAGNTLATCAKRNGLKLICVILNGHQTHYTDTKKLLDFGFENFQSVPLTDYSTQYEKVFDAMDVTGLGVAGREVITLQKDARILLPKEASMDDVKTEIRYTLPESAPEDAVADIAFSYGDRSIGNLYVLRQYTGSETEVSILQQNQEKVSEEEEKAPTLADRIIAVPTWMKVVVIVAIAGGLILLLWIVIKSWILF